VKERLSVALAGRYRIERELGEGGMATVYLARDLKHDRDVALKVLREDLTATLGRDRFLREIQLAAKLVHPHILPLFDSGEAGGALFYVMPNVAGHSLRDRLDRDRQVSIADAVRITGAVASALDHAHRQGVVHRDIKPENIMLQDGHALLADFGIGKLLGETAGEGLTQVGISVGTPAYMSPEQAVGEAVDGRSDVYSLGCVLYEMLVGEPPFTGPNVQSVIAKRFVQMPADVTALRDGIPRPVARALQRALQRTAIDRFAGAAEFATALQETDAPPPAAKTGPPDKSIAVLPFANMSTDPENEFFADGITEEILNALAQITELRVAGRTSSFSFKGKNQDLRRIGEELNVRTVLEGSVRRAGGRVRITAQLIDVTDGYHLWSESYNRDVTDVFAVQDEIATAIAEKMKATLAGAKASRAQRATDSIEAYEKYLKGRSLLYRRGNAIRQGLALMEEALQLDPEFGLAWAGVADVYSMQGYYGQLPPEVARVKAGEAAANAVRCAPDLAESHCARAMQLMLFEWDWAACARGFERSIALNPGYVQAGAWYYLDFMGLACGAWDEALAGLKAYQSRDQLSSYMAAHVAYLYAAAFNEPSAEVWIDRAAALEPDSFLTLWTRQLYLMSIRDWPRAIDAAHAALAVSGRQMSPLVNLGVSLVNSGDTPGARAIYDEMRSRAVREYVPPTAFALLGAALGDTAAAIAHCHEAVQRRDPQFVACAHGMPGAQQLQALPEHRQLLASIGIPGVTPGARA
jgi:eukaryotic-like serine/threonine-protein kinase